MENIYLILVVVLFALAISDLIVGVSNDAVNFLNSAIGSKAAPFKIIMGVAALGILFGTTFSSGMMEVARKGIFHPEHFYFSEIMIIFLAVMVTDILLLDSFNTLGMPTSTTVSIVFELLGAAVSVSVIKLYSQPEAIAQIKETIGQTVNVGTFINTNKAVLIISGILLSVIVAFSVGAFVQWISRLIFSFDYSKTYKYYGAIWGSFAITAITYFILIKGIKGSTFSGLEINPGVTLTDWIKNSQVQILTYGFIAWVVVLQIFKMLKINILKVIVLTGTFALAMAFAGNDLVNFIGVPLAGYHAFLDWSASGASPDSYLMSGLTGKVPTEYYLLLSAGFIMVITLWVSKKARTVIKTSIDLSRQDEGDEKFGSSLIARNIVRASIKTTQAVEKVIPAPIKKYIGKKFDTTPFKETRAKEENPPAFDMIRASVNLVVASILIAIGTSFKLPLSTTYVTFMVAMGTSLADKAWDKEKAVYRITGVVSVIGGWFFTAFSAFTVAFIIALLFYYGGFIAMFSMLAFVIFVVIKSHFKHKKIKEKKEELSKFEDVKEDTIVEQCSTNIIDTLTNVSGMLHNVINALEKEDRKTLKDINNDVKVLNKQAKYLKDNVYKTLKKFDKDSIKTGHFYVQVLDYLRETAHALTFISKPAFDHIDNNFGALLPEQIDELKQVTAKIDDFYNNVINTIKNREYEKVPDVIVLQQKIINDINDYRVIQIKRVKHNEAGTKNSVLYLGLLHEMKNLLLHGINLLKAQRDFDDFKKVK